MSAAEEIKSCSLNSQHSGWHDSFTGLGVPTQDLDSSSLYERIPMSQSARKPIRRRWLNIFNSDAGPLHHSVKTLAQLRAQGPGANRLSFGVTVDTSTLHSLEDNTVGRHVGVFASTGVGGTVLISYLLAQQVARGAGYLYLDTVFNEATRATLANLALQGGAGFETPEGAVGVELNLASAALDGRGLYVKLPYPSYEKKHSAAWIRTQLESFIFEREPRWQAKVETKQFFVIVPGAALIYNSEFTVLMQRARAAGVVFIFLEIPVTPFSNVSSSEVEALLQNTATKVFFNLRSPATAHSAGDLLAPHAAALGEMLDRPSVRISDLLLTLKLGEAIVLSHTEVAVVRMPILAIL